MISDDQIYELAIGSGNGKSRKTSYTFSKRFIWYGIRKQKLNASR